MSVPTDLLRSYVAQFVGDDPHRVAALAAKTKLDQSTIEKLIHGHRDSVSFEVADRVLCATGANLAWYVEPLSDIYWSHPLNEIRAPKNRCQRKGCTEEVVHTTHRGGKNKRYCSKKCQRTDWKRRARGHRSREAINNDVCKKGHDQNEHGFKDSRGYHRCRVCVRETEARYRASGKAAQNHRAFRERKKAA